MSLPDQALIRPRRKRGAGRTYLPSADEPRFAQRRAMTIPCFTAGTQILTPRGTVPVEALEPGDAVLTVRPDGPSERRVTWVGQRSFGNGKTVLPERLSPVRILAGAFGPSLPERDLCVSADHALFIDGHLVEAGRLVNGATVIREADCRFVTYHHVALDAHDVLLAENLAAESYLDCGGNAGFDGTHMIALHPYCQPTVMAMGCAPLAAEHSTVVSTIREALRSRAAQHGFELTEAIDARLRIGAHTVYAAMLQPHGVLRFTLDTQVSEVTLLAATGIPTETGGEDDHRALGMRLTRVTLVAGGKHQDIPLTALVDGFHQIESDPIGPYRWSGAAGQIPLPAFTGAAVLEITVRGQAPRWIRRAPDDRQSA